MKTIRLARPGDADDLLAIYAPYLSTTVTFEYVLPSREEFARRIADVQARFPYLVLEEDGQPIGYAYAHLLAERIAQGDGPYLATIPMTVRRNAYGRQLGSFHAEGRWEEGAKGTEEAAGATCVADAKDYSSNSATLASEPVPLTFIRAPRIEATGPGVEPLVTLNDAPVAVRHRNQIAAAFHPELDDDNRLYEALLAPLKRAY